MKLFLLAALAPWCASALAVSGRNPGGAAPGATLAALHKKMEGIASALEHMVDTSGDKPGSLANAKVAPELRSFVKELRLTLKETESPKDPKAAVARLLTAQASMKELTAALTAQQTRLMHEGEADEESLMLGVLMTRRSAPFDQQLEVIKGEEFRNLPVAKALLAQHDPKRPLFEQAAAYLDKSGHSPQVAAGADKAAKLNKTLAYFSKHVEALEHEGERLRKSHEESVKHLKEMIKAGKAEKTKGLKSIVKHLDREYEKRALRNHQQVKLLKNVVAALEKGDMKALKTAQDALAKSLEKMQQRTGNFLHLLQLGDRLSSEDCPYCAAQCIDKCHTAGNPYTQCLTQCADAGK
mmetsp:Transcript_12623/g.36308  ORF Transcript_12623/g.36308 Transcript_12623/m.36308 type:complete len:354 (-) Transcript_12623:63-1124(-)